MILLPYEQPWDTQPPDGTPLAAASLNDRLQVLTTGANFLDFTGRQGQLEVTAGSPTIRPSPDGLAVTFSGGAQRFSAGFVSGINTGPFTIEVACRITAAPPLAGFFSCPSFLSEDGQARGLIAFGGGANKNIYFWGDVQDLASGVDWLEDGSLQHVFVVSYGSGKPMRFYRRGVLIAAGTTPSLVVPSYVTRWSIGDTDQGWNSTPTGSIIKAGYYARALSAAEIAALTDELWANYAGDSPWVPVVSAAAAVPTITSVGAENITSNSAGWRVSLDYA